MSVITTFEDLPYTGAFTGNVTELCPVGALLPTQYRFEGRPWEIVDMPTVCGLCPVGCNVNATVREGKVKRILSRNHPEIDEGWICDKGRFAYTHLRAEDRLAEPLQRVRRRGLEPVSWEQALDEAERLLRAARGRVVTVLSGSETVEQAYALGKLLRVGLDSHQATLPEEVSGALDAYRLPLSAIRDADVVVVLGDVPVVERAPVVDLWIKSARRNGARILDDANDPAVAEAERVVLVWCGPGGRGGATVAKLAEKLGLAEREGCGAFYLPETPNGRGVADAWAACCDEEAEAADSIGAARGVGRRGRGRRQRPRARRAGRGDDRDLDVRRARRRLGRPRSCRARATSSATARSSTSRGACSGCAARSSRPAPTSSSGSRSSPPGSTSTWRRTPRASSPRSRSASTAGSRSARSASGRRCAAIPTRRSTSRARPCRSREQKAKRGEIRLVAYKPLFSGAAVERVTELQFQRPQPELELSADDARRRKIATGDLVTVGSNGSAITLPARVNRRLRAGIARVALEHAEGLGGIVEVAKAETEVPARERSPGGSR